MLFSESDETFIQFDFVLLDYYLGEWIGEEDVNGEPFTLMDFNGMGLYKAKGDATLGYVVINGEKVPYECNVADGLDGTFTYGGNTYTLTTNGDGTVTVSSGGASANLYRKDEMANTPLLGADGTVYEFNGGGNLSKGGVMTATTVRGVKTEYAYKIDSGSIGNLDLVISLYSGSVDGAKVGSISIAQPKFVLKLDGKEDENLDLYLPFAGKTWAISSLMNSFYIGIFDLQYETTGNFNGTNNVPFTYFPEYSYIYVSYDYYNEQMQHVYVQIYLLILDDNTIVVSSYPYLVDGDYSYASPCDEVFGTWVNTVTRQTVEFDGLADSTYVTGVARSDDGTIYLYTRRFGTIYMWKADDESVAYTVEMIYDDITGENVYLKNGGTRYDTMRMDEVDVLNVPIFTAKDGDNNVYEFNFDGTIKIGDKTGTYLLSEVEGDKTTVVITVDGKEITAVVDHSGTVTVID